MKYDVRLNGQTVATFKTLEGAKAPADKINRGIGITDPDRKAFVVGDYGKVGE